MFEERLLIHGILRNNKQQIYKKWQIDYIRQLFNWANNEQTILRKSAERWSNNISLIQWNYCWVHRNLLRKNSIETKIRALLLLLTSQITHGAGQSSYNTVFYLRTLVQAHLRVILPGLHNFIRSGAPLTTSVTNLVSQEIERDTLALESWGSPLDQWA